MQSTQQPQPADQQTTVSHNEPLNQPKAMISNEKGQDG